MMETNRPWVERRLVSAGGWTKSRPVVLALIVHASGRSSPLAKRAPSALFDPLSREGMRFL